MISEVQLAGGASSAWMHRAAWKRRFRLGFIALFFTVVFAPAMVHLGGLEVGDAIIENRRLADPPAWPRAWADGAKFFGAVDAWLNDHFGLRRSMVAWNNRLRFDVLGEVVVPQLTLGHNGFLYFNSHGARDPLAMIRLLCGIGLPADWAAQQSDRVAELMRRLLAEHPTSTLLVVPTKPEVYPEYLPDWLQAQCRRSEPPMPRIMAALAGRPDVGPSVAFPLDRMEALKASLDVYPKENFHWEGEGARRVAEYVSESTLGMPRLLDLPKRAAVVPSDLQHFLPGVPLDLHVQEGDYESAGITACRGGDCFPEFRGAAAKLADVSRYRHANNGRPRLLIVSDSFGAGIAGYFSEYFGEVWHLSTNNAALLSPEEARGVKDAAFRVYAPDRVLYVFHDFSIGYFGDFLGKLVFSVRPAS